MRVHVRIPDQYFCCMQTLFLFHIITSFFKEQDQARRVTESSPEGLKDEANGLYKN